MKTNFEEVKSGKTVMVPTVVETATPRINVRFKLSEFNAVAADLKKLSGIGVTLTENSQKFLKLASARIQRGA
jgi:hypothetical protein